MGQYNVLMISLRNILSKSKHKTESVAKSIDRIYFSRHMTLPIMQVCVTTCGAQHWKEYNTLNIPNIIRSIYADNPALWPTSYIPDTVKGCSYMVFDVFDDRTYCDLLYGWKTHTAKWHTSVFYGKSIQEIVNMIQEKGPEWLATWDSKYDHPNKIVPFKKPPENTTVTMKFDKWN